MASRKRVAVKAKRALHSQSAKERAENLRKSSWDESMKLGLTGLIAAFVARVFYDTYVQGIVVDYNFALYHGIIFGAAVALVWKYWPWRR
ncbi:MAG: hypothetical protein V1835_04395 [Candidatus Micrarchaeota archaeon]